ncbi:hypothetical protein A359_02010 [secondary endosymbiont of Ctenarytaina eucalypti]|uniref:Uncharacterized protein n=1 Tax=secondary endosymbiont of Ctenarytaina eucalypti TaxID=1199245 RepID=J3TF18_9ENTR|nr:hypothetical protein A359_02010 [secondary endosymbiont of Ctenarytaina eucalypti]
MVLDNQQKDYQLCNRVYMTANIHALVSDTLGWAFRLLDHKNIVTHGVDN